MPDFLEGRPAISTTISSITDIPESIEPPVERELTTAALAVDGRADRAIRLAVGVGQWLPLPASGATAQRLRALVALAVGDLTAARVVEAHTDALAILSEAAADTQVDPVHLEAIEAGPTSTWGVFAAEGPGVRVDARQDGDRWLLTGTKPWCSLAERLSHALITAYTEDGSRRLFAISLRGPAVRVVAGRWVARGLVDVPSGPIELTDCVAVPVGPDGWYLRRPGFAWGGIGVAACWYGGAVGLARTLREAVITKAPDQIGTMHLGAIDAVLTAARAVLFDAAQVIDGAPSASHQGDAPMIAAGQVAAGLAVGGVASGGAVVSQPDAALLAARVRAVVARAAEEVIARVGHALGPAPLALDDRHSRRVADLTLYVRQHHAERDEAALGRAVLDLAEWV